MATELLLDTLDPPPSPALVADCHALGATGCWVYVMRRAADGSDLGTGAWTRGHVDQLHANGLRAPAIVVPGNVPPPPAAALDAARAFGCDPVLAADLEQYSTPPASWEDLLDAAAAAAGWRELNYGNASTLGTYDPGEPGWVAAWLRSGVLQPLPPLPVGRLAWQFVNDVRAPSGALYDASVVDSSILGGAPVPVIEDTVTPSAPVPGRIFRSAQWYDWASLAPLQTTDQTASTGSGVLWTEAKKVGGVWYDRIAAGDRPGDWALADADVDDGGFDPTHFRPAPAPPPAPPPPSPPVDLPVTRGELASLLRAAAHTLDDR